MPCWTRLARMAESQTPMHRTHLAHNQPDAKTNQQVYDAGCEWCGTRIPSLDQPNRDGVVTYGLEFAHIFAAAYTPAMAWNGFTLCSTCHKVFDLVVKPRLREAISKALTGFSYQPNPKAQASLHVVGHSYGEVLDRLVSSTASMVGLPVPDTTLPKVKP